MTNNNSNKFSLKPFLAIWAVLTALGIWISIKGTPWLMEKPASHQMHMAILTVIVFSVAAAPVAAGIYAVQIYALAKWRYKGEGVPPDAEPLRNNVKAVSAWIGVSALLTTFLLIWGLAALASDDNVSGPRPMTVNVTGQQWMWSFQYPIAETLLHHNVESNILVIPLNNQANFNVTSVDVTHGFWVPSLGIKVDANPGTVTTLSVIPNKLGWYDIRCVELCGLNHSAMITKAHVVSDKEFLQWLKNQPASPAAITTSVQN